MLTILILFFLLLTFVSCNTKSEKENIDWSKVRDQMIIANKGLVKKNADSIANYVKHQGWNMQTTKTGLWYEIYQNGNGDSIKINDIVTIDYKIELLDNTLCYESTSDKPKTFKVGQGGVEAGLEEGILLLKKGDHARFIIPPHLAYGVMGDQNKIPRLAIIKYDLIVSDVSHY